MTLAIPSLSPVGSILIVAPPASAEHGPNTHPAAAGRPVYRAGDHHDAIAVLRLSAVALVCLSTAVPDHAAAAVRAAVAAMPSPPAILCFDPARPFPDAACLHDAAISSAAPPASDPLTRLGALLGAAGIARLLAAFQNRLLRLIAAPDPYAIGEGSTPAALAHRLGGLAGTLDFAPLSAAWLRVETDGDGHLSHAWDETRIAIAMLDRLLADQRG